GTSIRDAIAQMDLSRIGIVLVVDEDMKLLGTVTDGDVRRAILADMNLENPVEDVLAEKAGSRFAQPITAPFESDQATMLQVLKQHDIQHLPLVDQQQRVTALVNLGEFAPEDGTLSQAVVMAGGEGMRLRPLTEDLPKPMLPVGDRPLLELIIEQLQQTGIRRVNLTTHYKKDAIADHFGDGRDFGVEIRYVEEDQPLGTAGALSQVENHDGPLLVVNGDILTRVDFRAMLNFHKEHQAQMTVAVRRLESQLPYGVIETDGVIVTGISEKPVTRHFINAGIYLLEPNVRSYIPGTGAYDMPDLIIRLLDRGLRVISFPVMEYWKDIGHHADYQQAQADAKVQGLI
ncbi:nucleotidyltransferase family protein, partial [Dehalococcoidia bacterium]|nr:nucleotidyltransferase family protein [Dehalococcoidia bacterium]